jgi:hypothetical protein
MVNRRFTYNDVISWSDVNSEENSQGDSSPWPKGCGGSQVLSGVAKPVSLQHGETTTTLTLGQRLMNHANNTHYQNNHLTAYSHRELQ